MKTTWWALAAGTAAALACGGPLAVGGPTPEYEPIPVATESAGSLVDKFNSLGSTTGEVTVTVSEGELTSYLAGHLAAQPNATFSEPQVYLRDGKLKLYAKVTTDQFTANALVVMTAAVVDGQLQISITDADFGPAPVPRDVLESLATTINDRLLALVNRLPSGVRLREVAVGDGLLTLTATIRR